MELFKLATYFDHDEDAFAELLEHKSNKDSMAEGKAAESALAAATNSTHGREWLSNIFPAQYNKKEQTNLLPKTKK